MKSKHVTALTPNEGLYPSYLTGECALLSLGCGGCGALFIEHEAALGEETFVDGLKHEFGGLAVLE